MNRLRWVTGLSLVTLFLGSCANDREISQAPTPKPSVGKVAVKPKLPAPNPSQATQPVSALIVPTRAIDLPIPQGRPDPFGSIAVAPVKQPVSPETVRSQQRPQQASQTQQSQATPDWTSSVKTNREQTGNSKKRSSAQQNVTPRSQQSSTQQKITPPKQQSLPERQNVSEPLNFPPAPTSSTALASLVEVKGVMKVGERISAIVKTPNEPSRSVSAGDYLSGGAVRVKRIELGVDREPVVVLEQNGVEVVKAVSNNNTPIASL